MSAQSRFPDLRGMSRVVSRVLVWYAFWGGLFAMALVFRPMPALLWLAAIAAAFLLYPRLGRRRWRRRRAAELRLRPPAVATWRLALAVLAALAAISLLGAFLGHHYAGPGVLELPYRFSQLPLGPFVLPALAAVSAPLVEEFSMRGFMQARLERLIGVPLAITFTAAIFAALHCSRALLPYYFAGGLLFSYLLLATRSIWAPVALHAAQNTVYGIGMLVPGRFDAPGGAMDRLSDLVTLTLLLSCLGLAWLALPLPRGRLRRPRRVRRRSRRHGARQMRSLTGSIEQQTAPYEPNIVH